MTTRAGIAAARWLVLGALAGCGGVATSDDGTTLEEEGSTTDDQALETAPVSLPVDLPSPVPWSPVGELSVDDFGAAGWISVPYGPEQRYLAVRTVPLDGDPAQEPRACHRIAEARLASGASLLPEDGSAMLEHHQRFEPGPGAGVFVLSTTMDPLDEPDTLQLRVELVDCDLGIPASRARFAGLPRTLRVDAATETQTEPDRIVVGVRVLRAEDSGWASVADDPALAEAWAVATERFADVGITLALEAEAAVPPVGALRYDAGMQAFDELTQQVHEHLQHDHADARFVPVALVRCLEFEPSAGGTRSRPMGQATRIPGSLADARTPSLVVLAAGDCDEGSAVDPDPQRLGVVLAHELGHYLGLMHDDHAGAHLAGDLDEQLMRSTIAVDVEPDDAWFSPQQAIVMRRHPDAVFVR